MRRRSAKGIYHLALVLVAAGTFNTSILTLTGANLAARLFAGVSVPDSIMAIILCVSAAIVMWQNWVD